MHELCRAITSYQLNAAQYISFAWPHQFAVENDPALRHEGIRPPRPPSGTGTSSARLLGDNSQIGFMSYSDGEVDEKV